MEIKISGKRSEIPGKALAFSRTRHSLVAISLLRLTRVPVNLQL